MTPIFFALYLIFICCTFSRTQSTATILQETMGSDFIKFVHEMSLELKKLKEEHTELKRIVQGFVGNQEEGKISNSQGMDQTRLKREEKYRDQASDLKNELNDSVEQLEESKSDPKMIHSIRNDLLSIKQKLQSIQHEQGMTRVWRKKILMAVKELKLFERECMNMHFKGQIQNGFRRLHDESVLIIESATQLQDIQAKKRDRKDEADMVVGNDSINEREVKIGETHLNNKDALDVSLGRKKDIENKKQSMIGIVQSKRPDGENYVRADNNKEIIRKSASMYNAFTARSSDDLGHLSMGQTIVFNDVYLNLGNGYDKNSGIFRAPVAGLYLVLVTISSRGYNTPDVEVVKNGSPLCRVVVWIGSNHDEVSIGSPCNVLVQLAVGDQVWVRDFHHHEGYTIRGQHYSTFSMALLIPDQQAGGSSF
ncbi:hypothetical protein ACJMK2_011301 [Sinanodonta woodiana]|uniref:C1q domain-containing protein n=1 Tax=Sinanodonta woodiana TaxID=1069815 RepID=A0ABD3V4J0_SINWO